jgi:hypothetical protein
MIALTKWQKILATMYDLCGGEMKPLQYEDIVVEAFKKPTIPRLKRRAQTALRNEEKRLASHGK